MGHLRRNVAKKGRNAGQQFLRERSEEKSVRNSSVDTKFGEEGGEDPALLSEEKGWRSKGQRSGTESGKGGGKELF